MTMQLLAEPAITDSSINSQTNPQLLARKRLYFYYAVFRTKCEPINPVICAFQHQILARPISVRNQQDADTGEQPASQSSFFRALLA